MKNDPLVDWDWVTGVISNTFHFRKHVELRSLGCDRAILSTHDEIARQQILSTRVIIEGGLKIWFGPWNSNVYTLENRWFARKKVWVNVYGLPHHLG